MRSLPEQRVCPRVVSSMEGYSGSIFDVLVDHVALHRGDETVRREYMKHPGGVGIVALRESESGPEILLITQYRHAVRETIWEVPAGLRDVAGEPPLETAKRELREEADLTAKRWNVLLDVYTSPGCSDEELRVFLARDLEETGEAFQRSDEEEDMDLIWVPLKKALKMILRGHIRNPSAVSGILATALHLDEESFELRAGNWEESTAKDR